MAPSNQKSEKAKKSAAFIQLQVLGSGAKGAPASLYVFTDQTRYLFNAGEGTQRLANEHKFKLGKLEHIFITSKQWHMIGGLPGLALNLQDAGVPTINLHGPPALEGLFTRTGNFIILEKLHVHIPSCVSKPYFEDNVLRIDYVPIYTNQIPSNPNSNLSEDIKKIDCAKDNSEEEWNKFIKSMNPEVLIDYHPVLDGSEKQLNVTVEAADDEKVSTGIVLCYICTPKQKEATLLMDRCKEYGVPNGPLLMKLKSGENVTLPNGKLVLASDVTSQDNPDPIFIVIDCPEEEFLDSLVTNPVWKKFQNQTPTIKSGAKNNIGSIIHFTAEKILLNPVYLEWMGNFGNETQHVLLNDSCVTSGNVAPHILQETLHVLDENIFPFLHEGNEQIVYSQFLEPNQNHTSKPPAFLLPQLKNLQIPAVLGNPLLNYSIRPHNGLDSGSKVNQKHSDAEMEVVTAEAIKKLHAGFKALDATLCQSQGEFPKVLFLGTGSCLPNKTRNVSSILVEISGNSKIILDCGEGTFGQLLRFYGSHQVDKILTQIKIIYVSHLHADHHLGLISLLQERFNSFKRLNLNFKPVVILAPQQIYYWLSFYNDSFEGINHMFILIPNDIFLISSSSSSSNFDHVYKMSEMEVDYKNLLCDMGVEKIETALVDHCPDAFGISIIHGSGWKVVYSGDTRPCDDLVTLGMNCTLCIHEATMEDELIEDAKYKMHCTMSEAIEMGKRMNAKFTMLTHFSQRYAKLPKISSELELESNIGIAYDNMLIRLKDLPKIPLMYPVLKLLFADEHKALEVTTAKKLKCVK